MFIKESLEKIGRNLPLAEVREMYFGNLPKEGTRVTSTEVLNIYQQFSGHGIEQNTVDLIRFHKVYRKRLLDARDLPTIIWYFDYQNDRHISNILTKGGLERDLLSVARNCIGMEYDPRLVDQWREDSFERALEGYSQGIELPPLILSSRPGGARPDGYLHIIDGVHRSLALGVSYLRSGVLPRQEILIA
ncbi:hypothetical protein HYS94_00965 [Candidatus Daviesbacteria bacterium]|nr:hypothetical protein [Candidatus Daviesbacteria bacterium]